MLIVAFTNLHLSFCLRLMKDPTGRCEPYDQVPEASFKGWVNEADKMFRERKFDELKDKFLEEYKSK